MSFKIIISRGRSELEHVDIIGGQYMHVEFGKESLLKGRDNVKRNLRKVVCDLHEAT
jgi:hypothetical protein